MWLEITTTMTTTMTVFVVGVLEDNDIFRNALTGWWTTFWFLACYNITVFAHLFPVLSLCAQKPIRPESKQTNGENNASYSYHRPFSLVSFPIRSPDKYC